MRYSQNFFSKALFWFALLMKFRLSFSGFLFAQSKRDTLMWLMLSSPILPLLTSHSTLSTIGICKLPAHCFSGELSVHAHGHVLLSAPKTFHWLTSGHP